MAARLVAIQAQGHQRSVALMKFLAKIAQSLGIGDHVYVVGGAVRDFYIDKPIKDIDLVIDAVALSTKRKRDSAWFAKQLQQKIPAATNLTTNQYGVAIITVKGQWDLDGEDMTGEVIEIANARQESYGGETGKGYKPSEVKPATIEQDMCRREFTYNCLLWKLADLANGPDKQKILDLTGCGIRDLESGLLRCPSDPDKTFQDDPSRMLRAIKFAVRYNHKLSSDAERAIKRNAAKLAKIPHNAVSSLLIGNLLREPHYKLALSWMKRLGLLDVIAGMIRNSKEFRSTMENWLQDKRVLFMLDLIDVGLPLKAEVKFLSKPQQKRLREIALLMPPGAPESFLAVLKQPGKAMNILGLIEEYHLKGSQIAALTDAARQVLLKDPKLIKSKRGLTDAVREAMRRPSNLAASLQRITEVLGRSAVYCGAFLTDKGRRDLLRWWQNKVGDTLPLKVAHHCTIKFKPDQDLVAGLDLGAPIKLQVVGFADSERAQVVVVKGVKSHKPVAHVTVATAKGVAPADSDKLLALGWDKVQGPTLDAVIGYHDGKKIVTSASHRELHLFDFDGTLFRSPFPPGWWTEQPGRWWARQVSLSPPCVPAKPDGAWWVSSILQAAKTSIADQSVFAICCTGRHDKVFRYRIPELLKGVGLSFDEVHLNPTTGNTQTYKRKLIEKLHARHHFTAVHIWDDRYASGYKQFVEQKLGIDCLVHPVKTQDKPALCPKAPAVM